MPTSYSSEQTATIALNDLLNATNVASDAIDNSTNLYDALLIILTVNLTAGGKISIALSASTNNSVFSSANLLYKQENIFAISGSKVMFFYLKDLPTYYKLIVANGTTGAFASTGNSLKYRGVKY